MASNRFSVKDMYVLVAHDPYMLFSPRCFDNDGEAIEYERAFLEEFLASSDLKDGYFSLSRIGDLGLSCVDGTVVPSASLRSEFVCGFPVKDGVLIE